MRQMGQMGPMSGGRLLRGPISLIRPICPIKVRPIKVNH